MLSKNYFIGMISEQFSWKKERKNWNYKGDSPLDWLKTEMKLVKRNGLEKL